MAKVYLFNPENDVALGFGRRSFTLSPLVKALHADGASLPMWYAEPGGFVYDPSAGRSVEWYESMAELFGIDVCVADRVPSGLDGSPWGWSEDACRQLRMVGASVLDGEAVGRLRLLSHRRLTVDVMTRLKAVLSFPLPEVPVEAMSVDDVRQAFGMWGGRMFVKAPWSSSGRGVIMVESLTESVEARVANILRRQGSVMCEPAVDKLRDFAMEFRASEGRVEFAGYSLFFNEHGSAYGGNILAPDHELESLLVADGASPDHLHSVRLTLTDIFNELVAPYYDGYFGVDMMLASDGMLVPCVEVNLRMTMGAVAVIWRDRYMSEGSRGRFSVGQLTGTGRGPLVVESGRLVAGSLCLTPPRDVGKFEFRIDVSEL